MISQTAEVSDNCLVTIYKKLNDIKEETKEGRRQKILAKERLLYKKFSTAKLC